MNLTSEAVPVLEVERLGFSYGRKVALSEVGFKLQPGTFHALLGPNGAGKSTLFALISRLFALQQGQIRLSGVNLANSPAAALSQIGMVFQQSTLDLDLSVEDNLLYHGALHGLGRKESRGRIDEELQRLGLQTQRQVRVRQLNGGHRRRVEIARALLHRPGLLLLDEATVGLDTRARQAINAHVRKLCRDSNLCVLWATHLIEEIQPEDPVILLHRGKVIAQATSATLCESQQCASLADAFESLTAEEVC